MLNNSRGVIVDKQFDPTGPLPKEKELLDGQCMSCVTKWGPGIREAHDHLFQTLFTHSVHDTWSSGMIYLVPGLGCICTGTLVIYTLSCTNYTFTPCSILN